MVFHDAHDFCRTHIGSTPAFSGKRRCLILRNSTPNKCRMVEALPAESVVYQALIRGAFELDSTFGKLTQSIANYPEERAIQVVDGVREFMADDPNLSIEWLIFKQQSLSRSFSLAVYDYLVGSILGRTKHAAPMRA